MTEEPPESESGGFVPSWVITITTMGIGGTLVSFAEDPAGFIWSLFRYELVDGIFAAWAWFLGTVVAGAFDLLELLIVDGFAVPIRDSVMLAATGSTEPGVDGGIAGAVEAVQMWGESGLIELGLAAPFALAASWLLTVTIVAVLMQLAWGFLETYLPVESISGAVDALREALPAFGEGDSSE